MAIATPTAIREEPTGSIPTALSQRQPSAYEYTDIIPSYADGRKPSAYLFAAVVTGVKTAVPAAKKRATGWREAASANRETKA
jgi:hypothetical protein